jgi:hypothetical protein
MVPLSIDGVAVLAFTLQDGHLLLNLLAYDEHNRLVLVIKNNELVYSISPWDIQLVGRNLTIREAPRQFLLDIVFRPEYAFLVNSAGFSEVIQRLIVRSACSSARTQHTLVLC